MTQTTPPNEIQPADPPASRWIRYTGHLPVTVVGVGEWPPDVDARLIPAEPAGPLLQHDLFELAEPPTAPEIPPVPDTPHPESVRTAAHESRPSRRRLADQ